MEVDSLPDLAKRLKDKWAKPEAKTIDQVEAEFKAEFDKLKKDHPKAVLAILRDGEKGWDPTNPDKAYEGWKYAYVNCHGPSDRIPGVRTRRPIRPSSFHTPPQPAHADDLASIPNGAILAAKLVITRAGGGPESAGKTQHGSPSRATASGTRPRPTATSTPRAKQWKGVSGLYYGEDPDFWPVFLTHYGPAGGGRSALGFHRGPAILDGWQSTPTTASSCTAMPTTTCGCSRRGPRTSSSVLP